MRKKGSVLGVAVLLLLLSGCTIGRMLVFNSSGIQDYQRFPSRTLAQSAEPFRFAQTDGSLIRNKDIRITHENHRWHLDSLLRRSRTVAFLVIQKDAILFERYFHGYDAASIVPSFSMAKSYTSALVGCAIADGLIRSVEDPMVDYLPEMQGKEVDDVKILHLLQMTSGIRHAENYFNPFAGVARLYYGRHLHRQVARLRKDMPAGTYFKYRSIDTQLLGEIVARVTGKSLTQYMNEKIWGRMGTEHPATWSIDQRKNGMEKAFSSINATARDFAKFGRLYLRQGNWNGNQLLPARWVEESTMVDAQNGSSWYYQYQWWLPTKGGDFMASGHLGQFIYVNPPKDLIIVRLGKNYGGVDWPGAFLEISRQL
ncbi:MAG: hypothetical protein RLZZ165_36 [Bacteroidota bacterium]|jgi:CubicO group peptidase (beta-lactamase class C family)